MGLADVTVDMAIGGMRGIPVSGAQTGGKGRQREQGKGDGGVDIATRGMPGICVSGAGVGEGRSWADKGKREVGRIQVRWTWPLAAGL